MLAYPLDEAEDLLQAKLDGARQKMTDCQEDIDFLREQITVCLTQNLPLSWFAFSVAPIARAGMHVQETIQ